ncbi:MAG: tRNA (adenosine(37)-N6)-dimethylallyltransferase MiaA [Clostridia bacterium]|nr:tRNA (adenosine(37)-N6)-dimethylallyltransferase MiaA [Clostridia bacterium]
MKKVLVICGATASGKTKLAVDCALKLNTEIISADSQLVYKGLDIGTAKPTQDEMRGVKHHLIDIVNPNEGFSVSDYERQASPIVERLLSENKVPVICGGTGFYINSLLFDFSYGKVAANVEIREKYAEYLKTYGKEALYKKLEECDLATAQKLHINDTKRIIRALEIFEISGKKKSEQNDGLNPKYQYVAIALNYPREQLNRRIDLRVDEMFEKGLINEVSRLLECGIDEKYQSMQAIGYKEVVFGLKNNILQSTMRDMVKQNTRHYAKRQITFFKKLPNLIWLDPETSADKIVETVNGIH